MYQEFTGKYPFQKISGDSSSNPGIKAVFTDTKYIFNEIRYVQLNVILMHIDDFIGFYKN